MPEMMGHTTKLGGALSYQGYPKSIDIAPGTTFQVCLLLDLSGHQSIET